MQRSGSIHKDGKGKEKGGVTGPSGQGRGALEGGFLSERALNLKCTGEEKGGGYTSKERQQVQSVVTGMSFCCLLL